MKPERTQINLLPSRGFEKTTQGRVLIWILSFFRTLVILTEVIVVIAFLSRFWLDSKSLDLSEEIEKKMAILSGYADFEKEFRDIQKRLKMYKEITSTQAKIPESLSTTISYLPPDIFLNSIQLDEKGVEIEGSSPSERSIQQFIVNLTSSGLFSEVNLGSAGSNTINPAILDFKISAKTKT